MSPPDREPTKHPRKMGPVGRALADTCRELGLPFVMWKTKHAHIEATVGEKKVQLSFPTTPSNPSMTAKRVVRDFLKLIEAAKQ